MIPHVRTDGIAAGGRLGVYRDTYAGALARALRLSYPAVERLVGAAFFEAVARAFSEESPPRSACLDDYGAGFADFLARFSPAASLEYLPSVAHLERAVNRALRAPDTPPPELGRLAAMNPEETSRIRFAPHPSASLLRSAFPADSIWRAVLDGDDAALAAIDLCDGPVWLLVHRADEGTRVERLDEGRWRFTAALFAGRPLHSALEEAPCADAQILLAAHLSAGRLAAIGTDDTGGSS